MVKGLFCVQFRFVNVCASSFFPLSTANNTLSFKPIFRFRSAFFLWKHIFCFVGIFFFFIIILNIQNVWYNISLPFGFLVCWMQYSFWFFEYFAFAFLMAIQYFAGQLYFHKVAAKKRLDVWKYESFRVFWKWGKIGKKQ